MRITVLGTGTSTGVPVIGCDCEVCRSDAPENNRLRCSLFVDHPAGKFLVDCSTDFRQQALRYKLPRVDAVLITHDHADHINGIDDLRAYNFIQNGPIDIYAKEDVLKTLRARYTYCFNPTQKGGGVPQINLKRVDPDEPLLLKAAANPENRQPAAAPEGPVSGGPENAGKPSLRGDRSSLKVTPIPVKHGKLDILGYRLGSDFAYLTDCGEVPESSVALLQGVKILVVDALRRTRHSTHFSLSEALEFSRRVAPEQTWFTHMTDGLEHFETNASLPPEAQLLRDGQVIEAAP